MLFGNMRETVRPHLVVHDSRHEYPKDLDDPMVEDVAAWYFEGAEIKEVARAKFINRHGETILVDQENGLELKRPDFWHYGQPGFAYHYLLGFLGATLKKETP